MVFRGEVASCGGQAGDVEAFLHGHRHAVQGAAAIRRVVHAAGAIAGAVEIADHDGVDRAIQRHHPRDEVVQQFQAADFPAADHGREAGGGGKTDAHTKAPSG